MSPELEQTPEQNLEVPDSQETEATEKPAQPEMVDIDSVDKFRFAGREWTPKDFQGAYMMQSDYTRKTQALAEERRYYDNLSSDLEAVKRNPVLAEQFRTIYPEKFHNYLDYVVQRQETKQATQAVNTQGADPALMKEIQELKQDMFDRKVQSIQAELDAKFKGYTDKFPLADEEAVVARAQALLDRGEKMTDQLWERLWKSVHDRNQKLADKYYSNKVNQQKNVNSKTKDVASGGGTPGQAPKMPRTIKEASALALQEIENS